MAGVRYEQASQGRVRPFDPAKPKSPWMSFLAWSARQRPATWFLVNVGRRIDPPLMRISGGRLKSTFNAPQVLLTHKGAKSRQRRTTPLTYFTDGDDVILIACAGGAPKHPGWYYNLVAHPEIELWSKGGGGPYRAREAEGDERERLWKLTKDFYPGYASYQERCPDRRIPVMVCSPLDG